MSVTVSQIISPLENVFAVHGLPVTITSDNGPQFRSEEFESYLVDNGILHRKVTPRWAQANSEVERQNRSLLKSMRNVQAEGKNWRKELVHYLATYRTTPHTVTGVCPAELPLCRSCDLIRNCTGAERGDYTWNEKLFM